MVLALVLVGFALWRAVPRSSMGRALVLETRLAALQGSELAEYVDAVGVAATDLRPAGRVMLRGRSRIAVAEHGYIAAGARVRVVAADGIKLVVKEQGT